MDAKYLDVRLNAFPVPGSFKIELEASVDARLTLEPDDLFRRRFGPKLEAAASKYLADTAEHEGRLAQRDRLAAEHADVDQRASVHRGRATSIAQGKLAPPDGGCPVAAAKMEHESGTLAMKEAARLKSALDRTQAEVGCLAPQCRADQQRCLIEEMERQRKLAEDRLASIGRAMADLAIQMAGGVDELNLLACLKNNAYDSNIVDRFTTLPKPS
jgi:hypothetical protein